MPVINIGKRYVGYYRVMVTSGCIAISFAIELGGSVSPVADIDNALSGSSPQSVYLLL